MDIIKIEWGLLRFLFSTFPFGIPIRVQYVLSELITDRLVQDLCILVYVYAVYKKSWEELIAYVPWYDTDRIENDASNNSSIVSCVFIATVTFLPIRCLATLR
jgi:hypothetical protein